MKKKSYLLILANSAFLGLMLAVSPALGQSLVSTTNDKGEVKGQLPIYKNSKYPVEQRIDDLLSRMTLEEKVEIGRASCRERV